MDARSSALSELPLFAHLGEEELSLLARHLEPKSVDKDAYVFKRGDPGGGLFLVVSGKVEISITNKSGERVVLEEVEPRGFFGEVSLLDGEARSADAMATERTELLRLDREDLELLFAKHPRSAFEVMAQVTRRLRQANAMLRLGHASSPNQAVEEETSGFQRFADWLAHVSGTLPFLLAHVAWFGTWVLINQQVLPVTETFDPFPFGLLTMVVSLEAIFLSCVVLISQNRQAARDRIRSDAEFEANMRSAIEVSQLHVKLDHFEQLMISRFDAASAASKKSPAL